MDSYALANARLVDIRRLEAERDRAVEQRENANAATLRAEAERDRYRQALEVVADKLARAVDHARRIAGEHPLTIRLAQIECELRDLVADAPPGYRRKDRPDCINY